MVGSQACSEPLAATRFLSARRGDAVDRFDAAAGAFEEAERLVLYPSILPFHSNLPDFCARSVSVRSNH
jgi:hypothetical protein